MEELVAEKFQILFIPLSWWKKIQVSPNLSLFPLRILTNSSESSFLHQLKECRNTSLLQSYLDLNLRLTFHATPSSKRCRLCGLEIRYYVKLYLILGHAIWLSLYSPGLCMEGEHAVSLQRSLTSEAWEDFCSLDHNPSAGFVEPFYILVKYMISKGNTGIN